MEIHELEADVPDAVELTRGQAARMFKKLCALDAEWTAYPVDKKVIVSIRTPEETWWAILNLDYEKPYPLNEGSLTLVNKTNGEETEWYKHEPLSLDTQAAKMFLYFLLKD